MVNLERASSYLAALYGPDQSAVVSARLERICEQYERLIPKGSLGGLSERDALLIAYPDHVQTPGVPSLQCLSEFADMRLKDLVSGIHLLPFFPSSSDDGFAVIDYRAVDPAYGDWDDIATLGKRYRLMFDAVINHVSAESPWFQAFLRGDAEYRDYFIEVAGNADVSKVVRPRSQPLLTHFGVRGADRAVWTTFGPDQIDLNYKNPDVLLEIIDVLLYYVLRGASFIRLDAIAYLWKELDTACIHLPQTHLIVKLFRALLAEVAPHVFILTETNVPETENLTYFGDGADEADLVYNFALPPLVLHAFRHSNAGVLSDWAGSLKWPSEKSTYFNFLASHDGIGLNAARGILKDDEIESLARSIERGGGAISWKDNFDGTKSPYEINANYFDALDVPGEQIQMSKQVSRFVTAHAILLALRGLPGLYLHSLVGSRGWPEGVSQTGRTRSINREKLDLGTLSAELSDDKSRRAQIFGGIGALLRARRNASALSPQAPQRVLDAGANIFALIRGDADSSGQMLCLHNLSPDPQPFACDRWNPARARAAVVSDVISSAQVDWRPEAILVLQPFQSMWLTT